MADIEDSLGGENGFESRDIGRSRSRSRSRSRDRDRRDRRGREREDRRPRTDNLKCKRVYLCNLPYEAKWQDIKDLMKKEVGDAYVELYDDSTGKSTGCGCVEFRTIELAKECIEKMFQYEYKGRRLIVREEKEKDRERHGKGGGGGGRSSDMGYGGGYGGRDSGYGDLGGGMGMSDPGIITPEMYKNQETYGIPVDVLMQLKVLPPLVSKVFVSNLPYEIADDELRAVFGLAGKVIGAEILLDKQGKKNGKAVIEFETPKEAVEAIAVLRDQKLYDRTLSVHLDKKAKMSSEKRLPAGLKGIGQSISSRMRMTGSGLSDFGSGMGSSGMGSSGMGSSMMGSSMMSDNMNMMSNYGGSSSSMMSSGMGNMGMSGMSGMSGLNSMGSSSGFGGGSGGGMSNLNQYSTSMGNFGMSSGNSMLGSDSGFGSSGMSGMSNYGMSDMGRNMSMNSMSSGMMNSGMDSIRSVRSEGRRSLGGGGGREEYANTVLVKNLDYKVSWQDLKDHFRECGDVKYAKIKMEDGKSSGQGIVRFATLREAERAIEKFNGQQYHGRTMRLKMDDGK